MQADQSVQASDIIFDETITLKPPMLLETTVTSEENTLGSLTQRLRSVEHKENTQNHCNLSKMQTLDQ